MRASLPHVHPEALNALIMDTAPTDGTAPSIAPIHFHEEADIYIFPSVITSDAAWNTKPANCINEGIQHSGSPVVVTGGQEGDQATVAINAAMDDNMPSAKRTVQHTSEYIYSSTNYQSILYISYSIPSHTSKGNSSSFKETVQCNDFLCTTDQCL
jgi:hypothetical protein